MALPNENDLNPERTRGMRLLIIRWVGNGLAIEVPLNENGPRAMRTKYASFVFEFIGEQAKS